MTRTVTGGGRRLAATTALLVLCLGMSQADAAKPSAPRDVSAQSEVMRSYDGPYFGENNFPPGCTRYGGFDRPQNVCFRMLDISGINPLDTYKIDVLLLVPASATAERDLRIMRQAIEMWDQGFQYLAPRMGLPWLKGVEFRVSTDVVDLSAGAPEIPITTVSDPEIVVIGANVPAGAGAGISPLQLPCREFAAPFEPAYWQHLPGFESHHDVRAGTYSEQCPGGGGNVCVVLNGAQDPDPTRVDWFDSFWLTSHEFGHCLTLGHVGEGGEGVVNGDYWGPTPYHEIMNYEDHGDARWDIGDKPSFGRCVSTLDVEVFASRMSRYLDVNGDGKVNQADVLEANDQIGVAGYDPMQVQHPSDHLYASSTGRAEDCPQPDLGIVPGEPVSWTPKPRPALEAVLDVRSPRASSTTSRDVVVTGSVGERSLVDPPPPTSRTATVKDQVNDATTPFTDISRLTVTASDTHVDATLQLGQVYPAAQGSAFSYSLTVNGMRFDSLVADPKDTEPKPELLDGWAYVGSTEWDVESARVHIHVPRSWLRRYGINPPYRVSAIANHAVYVTGTAHDDWAPRQGTSIGISAPPEKLPASPVDPSPDDDRDEVGDAADRCPLFPSITRDGCTARTPTRVHVFVDGKLARSQTVHAGQGPASFAVPVTMTAGKHTLRVDWTAGARLLARRHLLLTARP